MTNPNYPRPQFLEQSSDFKEPGNPEFGTDLAQKTREFLATYNYMGVRSREVSTPEVPAGVVFFTADIKLPESGEPKLLEFNGVGSQLEAYPEGQKEPANRIYQVLNSLDRQVTVLFPREGNDLFAKEEDAAMGLAFEHAMAEYARIMGNPKAIEYIPGIHNELIGYDMESAATLGIQYETDPKNFSVSEPTNKSAKDLRVVEGVVWLQGQAPNIDTGRFVLINPVEFDRLIDQKARFSDFFKQHGLEFARPRSWLLSIETAVDDARYILNNSEHVEKFILKPSGLTGGEGIELINRNDLLKRIQQLFVEPFDYDKMLGGQILPPEGHLRRLSGPFVVEEYISSKPILSTKNGQKYDGTMRIAMMAVTNNQKTTLVPICSYWKLPRNPIGEKWDKKSSISKVHSDNPSEMVSPEDFRRGFETLAKVMPGVLRGTLAESK